MSIIKDRIEYRNSKVPDNKRHQYKANDNISEYCPNEITIQAMQDRVAEKMQAVLEELVIDTEHDHNTKDTAKRIAKMFVRETFAGRYTPRPDITEFPNAKNLDQLYIVGPISIRSTCAHHFQNIVGTCHIGVYPGDNVIGLSKFNRLVDWYASRPQIQEELTVQIADDIEKATKCKGLAVVVRAEHMCVTHRGVKEHTSNMTTSVLRGVLRDDPKIRQEFFQLLGNG
jgi:GTP cyclohydrolase I